MLNLPRPRLENEKPTIRNAPATPELKQFVQALAAQGGSVMEQELSAEKKAVAGVGPVSRHLQHPLSPRLRDDAGNVDFARHQSNDEEYVIPDCSHEYGLAYPSLDQS